MSNINTKKSFIENMFGSFYINDLEIAIQVSQVHEVINFPEGIVKMPMTPDFLLGIFSLRGLVIPIINLKKLLNVKNDEIQGNEKIAVIDCGNAKVGIVVDKTSEILRVDESQLDQMNYHNKNSTNFVKSTITMEDGSRIIQIINLEAIVNLENIPQVMQKQMISNVSETMKTKLTLKKCITFTLSNQSFALDIESIREIIKFEEIKETILQYDVCLGLINLRGQNIPVFSFAKILKSDAPEKVVDVNSRVVLLNSDNGQFGLLVDSVDTISTYTQEDVNPISLVSKEKELMYSGCVELGENNNVIFLDVKAILANEKIKEITIGNKVIHGDSKSQESLKKKTFSRASYLTFLLERHFAVLISEIKEIINFTNDISPLPGVNPSIAGVMNLRGKVVTIIDTRKVYNMIENDNNDNKKILIFEQNNESFGLIVDDIKSILNVDQDQKMDVPSILTAKIRSQFGEDVKEIISVNDESETVLVVLNFTPLIARLSQALVA